MWRILYSNEDERTAATINNNFVNLTHTMLRGRIQTQKPKHCRIPFI